MNQWLQSGTMATIALAVVVVYLTVTLYMVTNHADLEITATLVDHLAEKGFFGILIFYFARDRGASGGSNGGGGQ